MVKSKYTCLFSMILVSAAIILFAAGCSHSPAALSEGLDAAQTSIDNSNFGQAQEICDDIREKFASSAECPDRTVQLGRLAILYMRLADHLNSDDNIANAYACYEEAFRTDSLAAADYFNNLDNVDDLAYSSLLNALASSANGSSLDIDDLYYEEPDSLIG